MLWLDVSNGDVVDLDSGRVQIHIAKSKSKSMARIGVDADKSVSISMKPKDNVVAKGLTVESR